MTFDATLVVPYWIRSEERFELALRSSELYRRSDCEVILIDNGSPFPLPNADIVLPKNIGYPAAVNLGLREASGSHLAVGSMDIIVPDGWVGPMIQGEVATTPIDKTMEKLGHRGPFWGAFWMFPRSVLTNVGFFDLNWPFFADRDMAIRVAQAGYKLRRVPEVEVLHIDPGASWTSQEKIEESKRFKERYGVADGFGKWMKRNQPEEWAEYKKWMSSYLKGKL
jgi:GT2 family glycosyltransferase